MQELLTGGGGTFSLLRPDARRPASELCGDHDRRIQTLNNRVFFSVRNTMCGGSVWVGAAVAQWGKRAVLQPQGCGFDPRSPH